MMDNIEYFYVVVRGKDGTLQTWTELPEEIWSFERTATTEDMYTTSKQIVSEVETNDLAMRVAQLVTSQLNPTVPNISDKIKDALANRGIDPDSVTVTE